MFRDEEGFLTEWLAFYKMMGFDHIMLFDDGSTDKSLEELQPWIDIGFVSVKSNWSISSFRLVPDVLANHFHTVMAVKSLLETECKLQAIEWGYHYFVSLDLDEYMYPLNPKVSLVDELHRVLTTTGRNSYCFDKYAYPATPHILEPVDLLTIEAYQSRANHPNKMNYYSSTAKKCAYPLFLLPNFTTTTQRYVAECCRFHGCETKDLLVGTSFCKVNGNLSLLVQNKGRPWVDAFRVNHYARSLEKFSLKQKTWRTSGGATEESARDGYTNYNYLHRSVGWVYDPSALRYSCQVRSIIREVTNQSVYLRKGDYWYRNPEFGQRGADGNSPHSKRAKHISLKGRGFSSPYAYDRYQSLQSRDETWERRHSRL